MLPALTIAMLLVTVIMFVLMVAVSFGR